MSEQYTREERIARKLCEIRGLNPDEWIAHGADPNPSGFVPAILLHSARYLRMAKLEVIPALQLQAAIDFETNPNAR